MVSLQILESPTLKKEDATQISAGRSPPAITPSDLFEVGADITPNHYWPGDPIVRRQPTRPWKPGTGPPYNHATVLGSPRTDTAPFVQIKRT